MTDLLALDPALDRAARSCRAIVETPQGARSKFDYDPVTGLFELAAVLPAGMSFPLSFGFIPGTRGEDGDPLDVLVLGDEALPVGVLLTIRLLGVIEAEQTEQHKTVRNDRLLGKVAASHLWADVEEAGQLGRAFTGDLERFFQTYNMLRGRRFEVRNVSGPERACALIEMARIAP